MLNGKFTSYFVDVRPPLPVGEQLHRPAELSLLLFLPDLAVDPHAEHLLTVADLRAPEGEGQADRGGTDRGVSFTVNKFLIES